MYGATGRRSKLKPYTVRVRLSLHQHVHSSKDRMTVFETVDEGASPSERTICSSGVIGKHNWLKPNHVQVRVLSGILYAPVVESAYTFVLETKL